MNCSQLPYDYRELKGSANESYNFKTGKWSATRIFLGPWVDRFSFINSLFSSIFGGGGSGAITLPSNYPEIPLLIPSNCNIIGRLKPGINTSTYLIAYDFAEITVDYESLEFSIAAITPPNTGSQQNFTYLTEEFTSRTEVIQIPPQYSLVSNSSNLEADIEAQRAVIGPSGSAPDAAAWAAFLDLIRIKLPAFNFYNRIIDYTITEHFVPFPKWDIIVERMSKINSLTFNTPSGNVIPPYHMIYWGPAGSKKHTIGGGDVWQVSHSFSFSDLGWNHTIDPTDATEIDATTGERKLKFKLLGFGQEFDQLYIYRNLNDIFGSY